MIKKIVLIAIAGFFINASTSVYADGCASLANSAWAGQAKLINKTIIPLNVVITEVKSSGRFFHLKGVVNDETLTGMYGCIESVPGQIASISIESNNISISSIKFSPDNKNPFRFLALGGRINTSYIDTTSDSAKNFLNKY